MKIEFEARGDPYKNPDVQYNVQSEVPTLCCHPPP